jgi:hypothetical protein
MPARYGRAPAAGRVTRDVVDSATRRGAVGGSRSRCVCCALRAARQAEAAGFAAAALDAPEPDDEAAAGAAAAAEEPEPEPESPPEAPDEPAPDAAVVDDAALDRFPVEPARASLR